MATGCAYVLRAARRRKTKHARKRAQVFASYFHVFGVIILSCFGEKSEILLRVIFCKDA
jgi:multisubunit Na+/H+ antiporter MnhG subunit